jgi:hypothetical protein
MADEPGGGPRGPALLREGPAYGATRAAHALRCGGRAPCQVACNRPDATPPLVQGLLSRAVGCLDGLGGCTPSMAMPPWVRPGRAGVGHSGPAGGLAVRDAPAYGHVARLRHRASEWRQSLLGSREQTPREESLTGETITPAPEDGMAAVGLEAIEGQADAPAGLREALEAERVWQRAGAQCVVTLQEMGDRAWGHGPAALVQRLIDVRDPPGVAVAPLANEGNAIQAQCRLRECQAPLRCRPLGLTTLRTNRVEAAPALERDSQDRWQGGGGAGRDGTRPTSSHHKLGKGAGAAAKSVFRWGQVEE